MIGKTEGVCRSVIVVVPGGSWAPTSAIRARTSFSAWIMSVPGAKSIDSSAAPRTDFDRTRTTPSTMLDRLLDRPGDGDLDVLDRQAGRLGDHHDPREGHLGIDAAGHAEHRDDRRRPSSSAVVRTISPKYGRARATRLIPPPERA